MRRRFKMSGKSSKRTFRKSSNRTNKMNVRPRPMRGGTRL